MSFTMGVKKGNMDMRYCSYSLSFLLVNCCLLFLLTACSTPVTAQPSHPTSESTHPLVTATKKLVTRQSTSTVVSLKSAQTDCPVDGYARAALLQPITLGTHSTLIYTSNDVSSDALTSMGVLKRYDTVTQRTSVLVASGHSISNAQVSTSGQWVLFLSQGNANKRNMAIGTRVQLIRVDGADLQTLYCVPATVTISGVHLSTDQRFLLLDLLDGNTNIATLCLLDLTTGTLKTELQAPLGPGAYKTITWLDHTRAYIGQNLNQAQPALYLLNTATNKDIHGGNLKMVTAFPGSGGAMHLESSADKSSDGKTLFLSYCFSNGVTLTSKITSQPATGGSQHDIYRNVQGCIKDLRTISSSKLLLTVRIPDSGFTKEVLMLANTNGSGVTTLYKNNSVHVGLQLNRYGQLPWSNISRDGHLYAFSEQGAMMNVSSILIGSFASGKITTLVSNPSGTVFVAGWTRM
jgi:hypothetical protein